MHVEVGTEAYGRVKTVKKTSVVTTFVMLQKLPVVPIESYYICGPADLETTGAPLLATVDSTRMCGVPLSRIDRTSAVVAYLRAGFTVMVLFGGISTLIGLVGSADGRPIDDIVLTAIRLAEACLATGAFGLILTYVLSTAGRRDRAIREYCGELLGMCFDPGRVKSGVADAIRVKLVQYEGPNRVAAPHSRSECLRALLHVRCDLATGAGPNCESLTDDLLDQLKHFDRVVPDGTADA